MNKQELIDSVKTTIDEIQGKPCTFHLNDYSNTILIVCEGKVVALTALLDSHGYPEGFVFNEDFTYIVDTGIVTQEQWDEAQRLDYVEHQEKIRNSERKTYLILKEKYEQKDD